MVRADPRVGTVVGVTWLGPLLCLGYCQRVHLKLLVRGCCRLRLKEVMSLLSRTLMIIHIIALFLILIHILYLTFIPPNPQTTGVHLFIFTLSLQSLRRFRCFCVLLGAFAVLSIVSFCSFTSGTCMFVRFGRWLYQLRDCRPRLMAAGLCGSTEYIPLRTLSVRLDRVLRSENLRDASETRPVTLCVKRNFT